MNNTNSCNNSLPCRSRMALCIIISLLLALSLFPNAVTPLSYVPARGVSRGAVTYANIATKLGTKDDKHHSDDKNYHGSVSPSPFSGANSPRRRTLFTSAASAALGISSYSFSLVGDSVCNCQVYSGVPKANALAEIKSPPSPLTTTYDLPRNYGADAFFSWSMSVGMEEYENDAQPYKMDLFQKLFSSLSSDRNERDIPVVVEIGMGTFPNAPYYARALKNNELQGLDIVGVDPNDSMSKYAQENFRKAGLLTSPNISLRTVHGVAEALPFADNSIDVVVGTLTLCSVVDPQQSLSEIRRVLKPNSGKYVFWEHVLSETDSKLAEQQKILSPLQLRLADGCHLDRRTGVSIKEAGFKNGVDIHYLNLEGKGLISPTVFGIATA